jgi:hypothetical protein
VTWQQLSDASGFGHLFDQLDDLEAQAEAAYDLERRVDLVDRSRAEYAAVTLGSRLAASLGNDVVLHVTGVGTVEGRLDRVGPDWCGLRSPHHPSSDLPRCDWVLPLDAVELVKGASDRSLPEVAWSPVAGLRLGSALRRIADARRGCVVRLRDGGAHEVVLDRIGADFVEAEAGASRLLVAYAALAGVQSRD